MEDSKGRIAGAAGSGGGIGSARSGVLSILADNFTILRNRDIRVYLSGNAVSLIGDWMQQTAQAWVVWELTHSTTALGIVAFFSQIPFFLFGPWVGVISDRYDRRKILLVTQTLIMLFAFTLAALVQWHLLQLWYVYVLAFLLGIVTAFDVTAEQAFMGDIAGAGNIRKAVAVNNSLTQLTRLAGPSVAGWLISRVGIAPSFWINGLTIVITIICIISVHTRREAKKEAGNYRLQVDRQTKAFYLTEEAAEAAGLVIKKGHPVVQVSIYNSAEGVNKIIELPT